MRKLIPILLLLIVGAGIGIAQPIPAFTGLSVDLPLILTQEYYDTVTVDSIAVDTLPEMLWFFELGLVDTTDADTFYCYPNTSATTKGSRGTWSGHYAVRLLGAHPNKFSIPQKWSWGPLAVSTITYWCWYGSGGANAVDSTQKIWMRGYTIPPGYAKWINP
jgi:hypothetical protein